MCLPLFGDGLAAVGVAVLCCFLRGFGIRACVLGVASHPSLFTPEFTQVRLAALSDRALQSPVQGRWHCVNAGTHTGTCMRVVVGLYDAGVSWLGCLVLPCTQQLRTRQNKALLSLVLVAQSVVAPPCCRLLPGNALVCIAIHFSVVCSQSGNIDIQATIHSHRATHIT